MVIFLTGLLTILVALLLFYEGREMKWFSYQSEENATLLWFVSQLAKGWAIVTGIALFAILQLVEIQTQAPSPLMALTNRVVGGVYTTILQIDFIGAVLVIGFWLIYRSFKAFFDRFDSAYAADNTEFYTSLITAAGAIFLVAIWRVSLHPLLSPI